ncbi:MAG TPA: undecaprenyl-phosphate glucose phosphotransferase, partial [Anaerolineae bacterium]|nr:undecaprenyl-phosphate glucose phosphotransferase [Anaerolineae bacterium]
LFVIGLMITDAAMIALAFLLAYTIRFQISLSDPTVKIGSYRDYIGLLIVQVVTIVIVAFWSRRYHLIRAVSRIDEFYAMFGIVSIGTMMSVAVSTLLFKNIELDLPRALIIYAWMLTIVLMTLGRILYHSIQARLQGRGVGRDRALIVGTGDIGRLILEKIKSTPSLGYEVIGFVTKNGELDSAESLGAPVLGSANDLPDLIDNLQIDEVIIALPEASHTEILDLISKCSRASLSIKVFPDVFQIIANQVTIDDLGGLPLLSIRDVRLRGWRVTVKRLVDLLITSSLLVILSPFMFLVGILIKIESPGSVFYAQERMGLDARPFLMIKFRSMRKDAEANGPGWTTPDDPRRTRLGRLLRRLNVDELPQLINVLLGDMSLVGPRPERPIYVEQFKRTIPRYMERHNEKAGLTGWAQVNGLRGDTSIEERTKYDLWYIENWSLLLDFKILIRTIFRTFTDRSAY